MRFELTVLRICNPLHWASLPPHDLFGAPPETRTPTNGFGDRHAAITSGIHLLILVPPAGVEPTLANYLLHTGYKSAVLPLNYRGIFWLRGEDSHLRSPAYETGGDD